MVPFELALRLREAGLRWQPAMGDKFSLEGFHNEFLKQGFPPIKLIRRLMIGDESPVL